MVTVVPRPSSLWMLDMALRLGDEAVDHAQAQARPLADFLGREERIEDARQHVGRDARPGVGDGENARKRQVGLGVLGLTIIDRPWQLYVAFLVMIPGWAAMGGGSINTIIAQWFNRRRGLAASLALNGATCGGLLFAPAFAWAIDKLGLRQGQPRRGRVRAGDTLAARLRRAAAATRR